MPVISPHHGSLNCRHGLHHFKPVFQHFVRHRYPHSVRPLLPVCSNRVADGAFKLTHHGAASKYGTRTALLLLELRRPIQTCSLLLLLLLLLLLYYIRFTAFFIRTTWVSRHHKGKPFWILMKQLMLGWQWHQLDHMQNHLNLEPRSRQITTTPVRRHSVFKGRMLFLKAIDTDSFSERKLAKLATVRRIAIVFVDLVA